MFNSSFIKKYRFYFINNFYYLILLSIIIYFTLNLFYFHSDSWYNVESIGTFNHFHKSFNFNNFEEFLKQIYKATINDGTANGRSWIDPNPGRFRPLSHFIEIINHSARFYLFFLISENPMLNTPSAIFCSFFLPFLSFKTLRLLKVEILFSLLISLLILSITPILSTFYFTLRPAKSLLIIFSFVAFYFFIKNLKKSENKNLFYIALCNLCLILSDEEGFFLSLFFTFMTIFSLNNRKIIYEWFLINFILILSILSKIVTSKHAMISPTAQLDSSILESISSIINIKQIFLTVKLIILNFNFGTFAFLGNFSLLIYFLYLIPLILPFFIKTKNIKLLKYMFIFFLIFFLIYLFFNGLLENFGGGILLRATGYYYGVSRAVFFILFIYYFIILLKNINFSNISKSVINFFKISAFTIIFFVTLINLNNFRYLNKIIYNFHWENVNEVNFFNNLKIIRNNFNCTNSDIILQSIIPINSKKAEGYNNLKKLRLKQFSDVVQSSDNMSYMPYLNDYLLILNKCK